MITKFYKSLLSILLLATLSAPTLQGQNGSIDLHIKHIDYAKSGRLHIWLFNQSDHYQESEKSALHRTTPVVSREHRQSFTNIPSGSYVIVVLQDLNNNETIDYDPVIHYTKEPIGFSNTQPWLIRPTYKQCKFTVESRQATPITIRLSRGFLFTPLKVNNKTDQ